MVHSVGIRSVTSNKNVSVSVNDDAAGQSQFSGSQLVTIDGRPRDGLDLDPLFSLLHELGTGDSFADGPLLTAVGPDDIPADQEVAGGVLNDTSRLSGHSGRV